MSSPYDKTDRSQSDALTFELELKHSAAKVWRALTDPVLLEKWLMPVIGFKVEPGTEFTVCAPPLPNWDGKVACKVLESDTRNKLSYTWRVGDIDTVVAFTLTPLANGTRLSIVQSGFRENQKQNFGGARYGWNLMSGRLVDLLDQISTGESP